MSSGIPERSFEVLNSSRVNALRATVDRHSDTVSRVLLTSKETLKKKAIIEAAFRACRDTFIEMSTVLINLLDERSISGNVPAMDVRKVVVEMLDDLGRHNILKKKSDGCLGRAGNSGGKSKGSYASVIGCSGDKVSVTRGPTVDLPNTVSFLVVPEEKIKESYTTSQITRETLCKVFKPAEYGLRIKKLTYAKDSGVRIEAFSPDIDKIKAHPGIVAAGLKVCENTKMNPRIIVHKIPAEMSEAEIKEEIIAQNLSTVNAKDLKIVYKYSRNRTNAQPVVF